MKLLAKIIGGLVALLVIAFVVFVVATNYRIATTETVAYDAHAQGRYLNFAGHRWHYLTLGDVAADPTGAPVLLLHGFILSGAEGFAAFKEKIAETRGVVAPDYLGYGHSERVLTPGEPYEITHTAKAIAAMLDELGIDKVDIVGHSYGGVIAAQFALDYPARVRRIVFLDAAFYVDISGTRMYETGLGIGRAMAWHIISGPLSFIGNSCKRNPKCTSAPYALIADNTEAMRAAMYTNAHSPVFAGRADRLGEISAPSLVLNGENDFLIPPEDAKQLADALADARLAFIPQAGHMPYMRKLDETYNAVMGFLQPST